MTTLGRIAATDSVLFFIFYVIWAAVYIHRGRWNNPALWPFLVTLVAFPVFAILKIWGVN